MKKAYFSGMKAVAKIKDGMNPGYDWRVSF